MWLKDVYIYNNTDVMQKAIVSKKTLPARQCCIVKQGNNATIYKANNLSKEFCIEYNLKVIVPTTVLC